MKKLSDFRYTRSEKRAISVLVFMILMINGTTLITRALTDSVQPSSAVDGTLGEPDVQEAVPIELLEINSADSVALLDLYGIGPVYSSRIIKYRELLGGYVRLDQLGEVYGMDSERMTGFIDQVCVDSLLIRKINLTTVTFRDLLRHPYVSYEMVKAFVNHRDRHGPPKTVQQAWEGSLWPDSLLTRLSPYLSVTE